MVLRLDAVAFDVADAAASASFYARLLDRPVVDEEGAALLPGDQTQVGLRFVTSTRRRMRRPRVHLHLTSSSPADQRRTVAEALRLGGRHLDVGQSGAEGFVVLTAPGGGELCVIAPDNRYLAGTGRLGEVTCDGTRDAGLFWRDALGWRLVWDEGDQTAIQSPLGGTKIAWDRWDSPAGEPRHPTNRERFDLVSTQPSRDVERLLSLGASRGERVSHGVGLVDPDGNHFSVRLG